MRETGDIALPEDGPVSWTARADLAEATVAALTKPGLFDGISLPLTSSQPLDFADIARIASGILGRTIPRKTTSDEEYRMGLISHGLPADIADGLGGLYKASRAREFAAMHPSLERLLGRPPVSMQDVLDDFLRPPENKSS